MKLHDARHTAFDARESSDGNSDANDDYDEPATASASKRKRTTGANGQATKKGRRIDTDDEDGEYQGDEDVVLQEKSRSKSKALKVRRITRSSFILRLRSRQLTKLVVCELQPTTAKSNKRKPSIATADSKAASTSRPRLSTSTSVQSPAPVELKAENDKTRKHCITQLTGIFKSIFSIAEANSGTADDIDTQALTFAENVEGELFDGFAEVDAKGVKGPKQKYLAKFRSLHFNLKSNAAFRSRISANDLLPVEIVNISSEELLTPELRALAENIRAASLKQSVKEVVTAPTAKRTHKGEEEIDNFVAGVVSEVSSAGARDVAEREKTLGVTRVVDETILSRSPTSQSPRHDPSNLVPFAAAPTSSSRPRTSLSLSTSMSTEPIFGIASSTTATPSISTDLSSTATNLTATPAARNRASFDLNSILSAVKPSPLSKSTNKVSRKERKVIVEKDEDAMEMDTSDGEEEGSVSVQSEVKKDEEEEEEKEGEDYDPFKPMGGGKDDDFESILLGHAPRIKKPVVPVPIKVSPTLASDLSELPPIWAGDVIVPDEGGFPAFGVQVGGRPFAPTPDIWNQLLPRGLTMDGRIPTKTASKYLVECSFANGRELIVVGLLPDLTGPSEYFPTKPSAERCAAKYAHVVEFYVKKDRIGVIAPSETLKKIVKDIYIIPLKKDQDLPEYVELLDEHCLPENGRDQDLLLAVLVLQKGSIPSLRAALQSTSSSIPYNGSTTPLASSADLSSILSSLVPTPALLPPSTHHSPYIAPPSVLPAPLPLPIYASAPPPILPTPPMLDLNSLTSLLSSNVFSDPSLLAALASASSILPSSSTVPLVSSDSSYGGASGGGGGGYGTGRSSYQPVGSDRDRGGYYSGSGGGRDMSPREHPSPPARAGGGGGGGGRMNVHPDRLQAMGGGGGDDRGGGDKRDDRGSGNYTRGGGNNSGGGGGGFNSREGDYREGGRGGWGNNRGGRR